MTQAFRYHRFSTKIQDKGSSLDRQDEATRALCEKHKWEIVETIEDKGRSAWKGDHLRVGNLGKFRQRVDAGDIPPGSMLVIENLDRLSRQDVKLARRWIEAVTEAGIAVAVCNPEKVFDEASLSGENIIDLLQYLLEAQRSVKEGDRKSALLKGAWEKARKGAREGQIITRRAPGWLSVEGTKSKSTDSRVFVVNELRADVVRLIYQLSADGLGLEGIAKQLNRLDIEPWGYNYTQRAANQWKTGYIRDLLASPAVEGEYHPKIAAEFTGERIEGYFPRIVDADLVDRARAARLSRRGTGGPTHSEAKNLFTRKLRCYHCGDGMFRTVNHNKGRTYEYFKCLQYKNGGACVNRTMYRYSAFEKAALHQILHLALDDQFFSKTDETAPLVRELATQRKALENKEAEQARLLSFVMRFPEAREAEDALNEMRPELAALRTTLQATQEALQRARGSVAPEEHVARVLEVRDAIHSEDPLVREPARRRVRDAIQSVVTLIECRKDDPFAGTPQKTITMILAGGYAAYKFSNEGELLGEINLHNRLDLHRGLAGAEDQVAAITRRQNKAA